MTVNYYLEKKHINWISIFYVIFLAWMSIMCLVVALDWKSMQWENINIFIQALFYLALMGTGIFSTAKLLTNKFQFIGIQKIYLKKEVVGVEK